MGIRKNIGKHIELKKQEVRSTKEIIKDLRKEEHKTKKDEKDHYLTKLGLEVMKQYYIDWCDKEVPALNNKTPREAIKTGEGKELLRKLLIDFENCEEHQKRDGEEYIPAGKIIREELNFYEE